jgi:hypothetical protein
LNVNDFRVGFSCQGGFLGLLDRARDQPEIVLTILEIRTGLLRMFFGFCANFGGLEGNLWGKLRETWKKTKGKSARRLKEFDDLNFYQIPSIFPSFLTKKIEKDWEECSKGFEGSSIENRGKLVENFRLFEGKVERIFERYLKLCE